MIVKFSGFDKTKIMAQICSYTILFTNDLRTGVEQFMMLIEQPGIVNSKLITVSVPINKYFYVKYTYSFKFDLQMFY